VSDLANCFLKKTKVPELVSTLDETLRYLRWFMFKNVERRNGKEDK
jgi:hypothetical protein